MVNAKKTRRLPTGPQADLPPGVDGKLLHLVRRLMSEHNMPHDMDNNLQPDMVMSSLCIKYREYQRKDPGKLLHSVQEAIRHVVSTTDMNTRLPREELSTPVLSENTQKCMKCKDEEDDETDALKEDRLRAEFRAVHGSGLNAGLRERYRQLQAKVDSQHTACFDRETATGAIEKVIATKETSSDKLKAKRSSKLADERRIMSSSANKRRRIRVGAPLFNSPSGQESNTQPLFLNPVSRPTERYIDLGGMDDIIKDIRQLVEYPILRPELYKHLGVEPPRGVLLRGPPGTGKTHLANAIAGQIGVPFYRVSAPELVAGVSGESEERIRDLFKLASESAPSLIFMDELDVIAQKRGTDGRGMEKRMVAQLLTCMDQVAPSNNRNHSAVVIIAATNRPDAIDPALRRAGRFDKEIFIGVPDEDGRERIIKSMTKSMRLSGDFDYTILARKTAGYVGADIKSLAKEAAVVAINRIFRDVLNDSQSNALTQHSTITQTECDVSDTNIIAAQNVAVGEVVPLTSEQMAPLYVTMDDFLLAIPLVQPSAKREGFATVPDVTWQDIGALHDIREQLSMSVLEPIRHPERFQRLGLPLPAGVMLYGPPGCGKTLLAKAIANESGANFISVKGPELLDKYVGESERAVRLVFERARSSSPCIIFFDELDSLVPRRGSHGDGGNGVSERVVNQLLTEMDGLESRRSVFVIAATNRPELIDPAMLRPGRLDKLLYVPLPTAEERVNIIKTLATKVNLHEDVDLEVIGRSPRADGYSGADCAALLREAGLAVLKEKLGQDEIKTDLCIKSCHFESAFNAVMPSVSKADQDSYNKIRDRMARARSRGDATELK